MSVDTLQELITWPLSEISDETSEPMLNLNEKRKIIMEGVRKERNV